jgi:ornithine cyclodeaminase/alanine dehydrogenase-like protein (mu-crystallin family)
MKAEIAIGTKVLYLTREDVIRVGLSDGEVVELVRVALIEHGHRRYEMPPKIGLHPKPDTIMHAMPAYVPSAGACGIKWASSFPENALRGLPQTSGLLVLNDHDTGCPIAIMDATWITAKRTPAVSALACERLARPDAEVLGIVGCGVQGAGHLAQLPTVLPRLSEVRLYDTRTDAATALAALHQGVSPTVRVADSIENVVRDADVVVTATAILLKPQPIARDSWVKPGALVLPVDFDSAWEWETFVRADKFVVDSLPEMEYFMSIGYLSNGLPPLHGELGEVVAGLKPGREALDELIVDMNIGMGVEDVVVARAIYDRALAEGLGTVLAL